MGAAQQNSLILHAPNIYTGGGFILLQEVLKTKSCSIRWAQLDNRAKSILDLSNHILKKYVKNSFFSRFLAECRLWYNAKNTDTVLCFHGLPPLLPIRGHVIVFIQNRMFLEKCKFVVFPFWTKMRIFIERMWIKLLWRNSYRYIVQTPSMAIAVKKRLSKNLAVTIFPFVPSKDLFLQSKKSKSPQFDFVYIASGEAHKNHLNLLEAWSILRDMGLTPSLALTVSPELYPVLANEIVRNNKELGLNIINFGQLQKTAIAQLYQSSSALIFPSLTESFGLPLIEAYKYGLPIIASEQDFVRDVVNPVQTFDPHSPLSIARAARRFFTSSEEAPLELKSTDNFLKELMI